MTLLLLLLVVVAKEYLFQLSFTQDNAKLEAIKRAQGGGSAGISSRAPSGGGGGRVGGGQDYARYVRLPFRIFHEWVLFSDNDYKFSEFFCVSMLLCCTNVSPHCDVCILRSNL